MLLLLGLFVKCPVRMLLAEWQHRIQRTRTTSCWKEVVEINAKATIQNYSADFLKVTFLRPS